MKKYRILLHGRNCQIRIEGKIRKQGFFQTLLIDAETPRQAELLAISKVHHDDELRRILRNPESDPPKLRMDTIWELDILDDPGAVKTGRTFYPEKKWWQFWRPGPSGDDRWSAESNPALFANHEGPPHPVEKP